MRFLAARSASSRLATISPRGTLTPYLAMMALAWYSWIFMRRNEPSRRCGKPRLYAMNLLKLQTFDCIRQLGCATNIERSFAPSELVVSHSAPHGLRRGLQF